MYYIQCIGCGKVFDKNVVTYTCDHCGDILEIRYEEKRSPRHFSVGIWNYASYLPLDDVQHVVSLHEGHTPLYSCVHLSEKYTLSLFVKNEGSNPTGSFKDRGMTVGVSKARELKKTIVGCASTGNTSASLAAYAAKAGMQCHIYIPAGKIAYGKLAQALVHGATVYAIEGNFDDAMRTVKKRGEEGALYLLNSINPYRIEGQKTIAFEIIDALGDVDAIIVPVGNAANIAAIWKGINEYAEEGKIARLPRMIGVQSQGANPLVRALKSGTYEPCHNPETIATAIRIGNPVSWKKALHAVRASRGTLIEVTDQQILAAQYELASQEGIFVEPASATTIAALPYLIEARLLKPEERVVCVTTGHGLKDPTIVIETHKNSIKYVKTIDS